MEAKPLPALHDPLPRLSLKQKKREATINAASLKESI